MLPKRCLDVFFSLLLLIFLSPILILVGLLIKLTSKGPVFFLQDRLGLDGKVFRMFKFRSMVVNAEQQGTGLFSYENDPRITAVGSIIRRSSIDELPQLFNVLIGDMSLVGPRPPVTYELGNYEDFDADLKKRFTVLPGLTGLAQVSGRNDLSWPEKIKLDLEYIELARKQGILVDLNIMYKTIFVVFSMARTIEKSKD